MLTYSLIARELSAECDIENFEFIVSERVQVNPYNLLAECVNL